jgi:hypothetical protein
MIATAVSLAAAVLETDAQALAAAADAPFPDTVLETCDEVFAPDAQALKDPM